MGVLARIMFTLGGLCAVMGTINAALARPLKAAGYFLFCLTCFGFALRRYGGFLRSRPRIAELISLARVGR